MSQKILSPSSYGFSNYFRLDDYQYLLSTFTSILQFRAAFSHYWHVLWEFLIVCVTITSKLIYLSQDRQFCPGPLFPLDIIMSAKFLSSFKHLNSKHESLFDLLYTPSKSLIFISSLQFHCFSYKYHLSQEFFFFFVQNYFCLQVFSASTNPANYIPEIVHEIQLYKLMKTVFASNSVNRARNNCSDVLSTPHRKRKLKMMIGSKNKYEGLHMNEKNISTKVQVRKSWLNSSSCFALFSLLSIIFNCILSLLSSLQNQAVPKEFIELLSPEK